MDSTVLTNVQNTCSELSLQAGEQMPGTAPQVHSFLLIEYSGAWGPKAFEESSITEEVKSHISQAAAAIPKCKVLLVRRHPLPPGAPIHFFAVNASQDSPSIHDFQLSGYDDLLKIDVKAALSGDPVYAAHHRSDPLFLVCTHGRRDNCCARRGISVYKALELLVGEAAWQCSHLGGHRFAANVLCLPSGYLYGRVDEETVMPMVDAFNRGTIQFEKIRGRSCYPEDAQAAEVYLRRQHPVLSGLDLRLDEVHRQESGLFQVSFCQIDSSVSFTVDGEVQKTGQKVYDSCDMKKTVNIKKYHGWSEEITA